MTDKTNTFNKMIIFTSTRGPDQTGKLMQADLVSSLIIIIIIIITRFLIHTFNPSPVEPGYALPLKKPTDLDLHCLPLSM